MCISPFACELRFQSRRQIAGRRSPSLLAAKIFDWQKETFRGNGAVLWERFVSEVRSKIARVVVAERGFGR
jgi:hypothetical protein